MFFYALYVVGSAGCLLFPRAFCYWAARRLADYSCWRSEKDREAVRGNLAAVLGTDQIPDAKVREVFRNFGMYLVDFFRFSRLSAKEIHRWVKVEGMDRMRSVLEEGKGAIGLTAHLGNYELAGAVFSLLGLPINAVVMIHSNPRVNAFFERQRSRVGVKNIPVRKKGMRAFFEASLEALKRNEILGLVGDRDFFGHGMELPLFGRTLRVPHGPASFSLRTGAPIVPAFLVRESDGSYRFVVEPPIPIPQGVDREEALRRMNQSCLEVMARYIRGYPTQWYMFQEFWRPGPVVIL